jgi:lipopolysaccharide export system protein LptA
LGVHADVDAASGDGRRGPDVRRDAGDGNLDPGAMPAPDAKVEALTTMPKTDRARPALAAIAAAMLGFVATAAAEAPKAPPGLKMSGNEPIQIESDKLEVREKDHMAIFSGNVSVVQGPTLLKAGRLTVYYAADTGSATTGSAAIDRLEVDGTVYVKSEDQIATGDKGTFDMKTEMLVLTGEKVVLTQGENILVGCKLTISMKTNEANFEGCAKSGGRVTTLFKPNSAKTPEQSQ